MNVTDHQSQDIIKEIRSKYRDIVDDLIGEFCYLPEYRDSYDVTRVNVYHLLAEANRLARFEIRSQYPEVIRLSSGDHCLDPMAFWPGIYSFEYYKRLDTRGRRVIAKRQYKEKHCQ